MMRLVAACVLTLLVSSIATFAAVDYLHGRAVPTKFFQPRMMNSSTLGEVRELLVHLPVSYHRLPNRRYDVVYVLDGSSLDTPTADSAALLARLGLAPEVLVVGLPNVSGPGRQRDYTPPFMRQDVDAAVSGLGAGDRFLDFLEHEVVPLVDRDYRTTGRRLIAGHSRGGLLVVYALMARPTLFAGFLAHSPAVWRDEGALVTAFESWLASERGLGRFLYVSIGSDEVPRVRAGFDGLTAVLRRGAGDAGLRWASDVVPGADHQANGPWASPLGLDAYFGTRRSPATAPVPEPSRGAVR